MKETTTFTAFGDVVAPNLNEIYYKSVDNERIDNFTIASKFGNDMIFVSDEKQGEWRVASYSGEVTKVGKKCFKKCLSLIEIVLPAGVLIIDDWAFGRCYNLTNVNMPTGVTTIGGYAFDSCVGLQNLVLPTELKNIRHGAFWGCKQLLNLYLPDTTEFLSSAAAWGCNGCEEIKIFNVTPPVIGDIVFGKSIGCPIKVPVESVTDYKVAWPIYADRIVGLTPTQKNNEIWYKTTNGSAIANFTAATNFGDGIHFVSDIQSGDYRIVEYSGDVTKIEERALSGCTTLLNITLPDTVKNIGHEAFRNCYYVKEINMPDSLSEIGVSAFFNCHRLSVVTWPIQSTVISDGVFQSCQGLEKLVIHDAVTLIGSSVFNNCMIVIEQGVIVSKNPVPPVLHSPLPSNSIIYVPAESVEAYKEAYNWSSRKNYTFPIENEN